MFGKLFGAGSINAGMEQYQAEERAVLLDVRTKEEYMEKRIPGSVNLPLDDIGRARFFVADLSTPVYVYCRSGSRSRSAAGVLKKLGFTNVHDIGGILSYKGRTEGGPR